MTVNTHIHVVTIYYVFSISWCIYHQMIPEKQVKDIALFSYIFLGETKMMTTWCNSIVQGLFFKSVHLKQSD